MADSGGPRHSEPELLETQIAKVLTRAHPPVIMTLEDVANFCGFSYNYMKNDVQNQPDFPAKLDRFKQPRWSRDSIMLWANVSV
jgi:hypothetical protein